MWVCVRACALVHTQHQHNMRSQNYMLVLIKHTPHKNRKETNEFNEMNLGNWIWISQFAVLRKRLYDHHNHCLWTWLWLRAPQSPRDDSGWHYTSWLLNLSHFLLSFHFVFSHFSLSVFDLRFLLFLFRSSVCWLRTKQWYVTIWLRQQFTVCV